MPDHTGIFKLETIGAREVEAASARGQSRLAPRVGKRRGHLIATRPGAWADNGIQGRWLRGKTVGKRLYARAGNILARAFAACVQSRHGANTRIEEQHRRAISHADAQRDSRLLCNQSVRFD